MRLTQEYIDRKAAEYQSRGLSKYLAEALLNELQYRLEKDRIAEELETGEVAKPTTDTSGTT